MQHSTAVTCLLSAFCSISLTRYYYPSLTHYAVWYRGVLGGCNGKRTRWPLLLQGCGAVTCDGKREEGLCDATPHYTHTLLLCSSCLYYLGSLHWRRLWACELRYSLSAEVPWDWTCAQGIAVKPLPVPFFCLSCACSLLGKGVREEQALAPHYPSPPAYPKKKKNCEERGVPRGVTLAARERRVSAGDVLGRCCNMVTPAVKQ